ncbi:MULTISPECIES: hypothetical protein [unclassified Kitasatospora]
MTDTTPTPDAPDALGSLLSRHPVANRTRWTNAAWALAVGVPLSWLGLWLLLRSGDSGGRALGVLIGLGVSGLWLGAAQAVRALRGGRGEYFELRENGLTHGNAHGATGSWTWEQITTITTRPGGGTAGALAHRFGNDYRCVLGLADGGRLRVDGLAAGASTLGNAVIDRCPHARMVDPDGWTRRFGGLLLLGAALCVGGVIAMVGYISAHPDYEKVTVEASGMVDHEYVHAVDDGTIMLLALGIAACALGAVILLALFVHGRLHRRL